MKKYSFFLLGVCFLLVSCGENPNNDPAFAPVVNPTPKYFMTVKGFIDPSLPKNLALQWDAVFFTTNSSCNYVLNKFEGVDVYRTRNIIFNVLPDAKGNYEIKIPLDYFNQGKCAWKIQNIMYSSVITGNVQLTIANFNDNEDLLSKNLSYKFNEIKCVNNFEICHYGEQNQYDTSLSRLGNYTYQLNIIGGK